MVASRESGPLAEVLIRQSCAKQGVGRDQLTIHADRGSSMTSKPVAFLLADLGITQSHSRPHVSGDNPFSEAQFKTLKRAGVLDAAYSAHPERFVRRPPEPPKLPTIAAINPPQQKEEPAQ